ncbi:beta-lactamase/transpeptidase-like protein [Fusarium flagelliforme]|uniref:beta-lactamase/transpeptidase-like protein n=1 Tax=Fusarium flagelliforme TaxID=2675880 RepID=UPI001E8EA8D1|nr:beta-lactamase/transpeptidase-like protein [Fusarium flagelliforme]KAH7184782.1 beta-lactamase/transpeptidase-like protein [Fusarium flagelliforme]
MGGGDINDPFTPELSEFVTKNIDEWKVAGIAIGVIDGDDIFSKGFGFATLPNVPATPETLWYGGSTTKAFVTATLSQMIESKKYPELADGWKTRVSSIIHDDFVTQDEWATNNITLEDLACHRSGLRNNDVGVRTRDKDGSRDIRDIVRNFRHLPLAWQPRTQFDYNNEGYATLSYVVETITGRWLGDVLKETIWGPLEMTSTYLDLQQAKEAPGHLSTGYYWSDTKHKKEKYVAIPYLPTEVNSGAGAIISTVTDYMKWIKCLLRKQAPLSKEVHDDIRRPRIVDNPEPSRGMDISMYGLSWWRTSYHGHAVYWHSGSVASHGTLIYWLPDLDYGVVILSNYPSDVRDIIMRRLIDDKLGIPTSERFDIVKDLIRAREERQRIIANAATTLFPNLPAKPEPSLVEIDNLRGKYHAPGYGTFEFLRYKLPRQKEASKDLVAVRTDTLWKCRATLRHASGNFWVMFISLLDDPSRGPDAFLGAEFRYGVDNLPCELVITFPTGDYSRETVLKRVR